MSGDNVVFKEGVRERKLPYEGLDNTKSMNDAYRKSDLANMTER